MKILQVNCVYKKGSTGKIVYDVHSELLKQNVESIVCYGRGEVWREDFVYKTCGEFYSDVNHFWARLTGVLYGGCFFSTRKLISVIKREKPDVVHLHCINGYFVNIYRVVEWLKKNRVKTVLTLHAEFMHTGGCGHAFECERWKSGCGNCPRWREETKSYFVDGTRTMWRRMKNAFDGFNDGLIATSVSPWLMERAKASPILGDKSHCVVMNGLEPEIFRQYGAESAAELRKELRVETEKVVFHATPNFDDSPNHIKGGYYVLELAKQTPEATFVVAGVAKDGIAVPKNVILLGRVTDQTKLARLYSAADLTLLTSRRETFSMVAAESLSCGVPVVGFKAGGPETIALDDYCEFVEYGDLATLKQAVDETLRRPIDKADLAKQATKYDKKKMTEGYIAVYRRLTER